MTCDQHATVSLEIAMVCVPSIFSQRMKRASDYGTFVNADVRPHDLEKESFRQSDLCFNEDALVIPSDLSFVCERLSLPIPTS